MKRIHLITLLFLSQAFLFAHAETLKYSHPNKSQTTVSPTAPVSNKVQPNTASANTNDEKHEFVDLGLSVQWATTNIGSENPEDFGDFYAWGETTPKKVYNWESYKWAKGSETTLTKYCMIEEYGKKDLKFALDPEDDAATVNWGPDWHTPTTAEWKELINNCTWSKTRIELMNGYKITGKNGNWIFLPEHGFCVDAKRKWESYYEMTLQDFLVGDLSDIDEEEMEELVEWGLLEDKEYYEAINTGLYYLSNTVNPLKPNNVMIMFAKSGEIKVAGIDRSYGYYVRPVRSNAVESVSLDKKSITLEVGDSETLSATVNPANATNKTLKWSSDNPSIVSVTNGSIKGELAGKASITVYSSNGKYSTCTVNVKPKNLHDLGLNVKLVPTKTRKNPYGLQLIDMPKGLFANLGIMKGFIILKVNRQPIMSEDDLLSAFNSACQSEDQGFIIYGKDSANKQYNYFIDVSDFVE